MNAKLQNVWWVALVLVFGVPSTLWSQESAASSRVPSSELIPRDAFAAVVMFPQVLVENPRFKSFPREVVTAAGKQQFGFDPMLIEQATFVVPALDSLADLNDVPPYALIMRFSKMQGLAGNMIAELEEQTIAGRKAYVSRDPGLVPSFVVYDEATLIAGHDVEFLKSVIQGGSGPITEMISNARLTGDIQVYVDVEAIRPLMLEMTSQLPPFPPELESLKQLPEALKQITLSHSMRGRWQTDVRMLAKDAASAEAVSKTVADALEFGRRALLSEMLQEFDPADPVQNATIQYADRVWQTFQPKWTPQPDGARLSFTLHEEVLAVPFLMGFLGSSVERVVNPPNSTQNRLRQTALAALNYESAYRKMPPTTIMDENGKPLMSGRVAMLPFIEQMAIYENLRQDEPWDSVHNREFTQVEVPVYGNATGDGMIRYPVFPGSVWDDNGGKSLGQITDGTSNTILAIQAPPSQTVGWADPQPWKISTTHPMADVFGERDSVMVVFVDGHTEVLQRSEMTNEKLKALLTIGGGEVVR